MARKTQVSKEMILQAALEMLIRDGYSAINIKTLSKEIGCSTQPLVWHFESMAGLRKALAEYALNYANEKMRPCAQNGMDAFAGVGMAYINLAFDEPNLFKYLYMSGESGFQAGGLDVLVNASENSAIAGQIADYLKKRNTVVVNLKRVTPDQGKRIIDFVSGCLYAIGGSMQKLGDGIFLCAPKNINVQGKMTEEEEPKRSRTKNISEDF